MTRLRVWGTAGLIGVASLAAPVVADACPRCATAIEAREVALNDRPLQWLAVAAAPFVAMFALAAATSRLGRRRGGLAPGDDA